MMMVLLLVFLSSGLSGNVMVVAASGGEEESGDSGGNANYFNFEVEKRILERLDFYLGGPMNVNEIIHNFRFNDGFPNDMLAADRDLYLKLAYSVSQPLVYFGLEDGTCIGYVNLCLCFVYVCVCVCTDCALR